MASNTNNVFVIAEAGVNHNGRLDLAIELVDVAVRAGADAVKFQTFKSEKEISRFAEKAEYQKVTSGAEESLLDMAKRLELDDDAHRHLLSYCNEQKIQFMSTPFETESIDFLVALGLETLKISSGQVDNLPFLRYIGGLGKRLILSTGMATLDEVEAALGLLATAGTPRERITVLHCTTAYPTPVEAVNLRAMVTMRDALGVDVGYSDHTLGTEVSVAAVALGAVCIEKHFTLDRAMEGPDQSASLEPDELRSLVEQIRNVERALGDGIKRASSAEEENRVVARRSIVAAIPIGKGEVLSEGSITVKSPATGLSPMEWDNVIGKIAKRDFEVDQPIEL
jgi:N,N'-diacetyllegionaminate synthase